MILGEEGPRLACLGHGLQGSKGPRCRDLRFTPTTGCFLKLYSPSPEFVLRIILRIIILLPLEAISKPSGE